MSESDFVFVAVAVSDSDCVFSVAVFPEFVSCALLVVGSPSSLKRAEMSFSMISLKMGGIGGGGIFGFLNWFKKMALRLGALAEKSSSATSW